MAKAVKITQVRFNSTVILGSNAETFSTIRSEGFRIDSQPITIEFDVDPRFLRVTVQSPVKFVNLVPITNIGSLILDEK